MCREKTEGMTPEERAKAKNAKREAIVDALQKTYYLTDGELVSPIIPRQSCVLPGDIAASFYGKYRRKPPLGKSFTSWNDFIETLLDLLFPNE